MLADETYWIPCPKCCGKMIKARRDTKAENLPAYCKHCKNESIINIVPLSRVTSK